VADRTRRLPLGARLYGGSAIEDPTHRDLDLRPPLFVLLGRTTSRHTTCHSILAETHSQVDAEDGSGGVRTRRIGRKIAARGRAANQPSNLVWV
jgi:hypothetical protein